MAFISDKYVVVISDSENYAAVISDKYMAVICDRYLVVLSDKSVAVIYDGRRPTNLAPFFNNLQAKIANAETNDLSLLFVIDFVPFVYVQ